MAETGWNSIPVSCNSWCNHSQADPANPNGGGPWQLSICYLRWKSRLLKTWPVLLLSLPLTNLVLTQTSPPFHTSSLSAPLFLFFLVGSLPQADGEGNLQILTKTVEFHKVGDRSTREFLGSRALCLTNQGSIWLGHPHLNNENPKCEEAFQDRIFFFF